MEIQITIVFNGETQHHTINARGFNDAEIIVENIVARIVAEQAHEDRYANVVDYDAPIQYEE